MWSSDDTKILEVFLKDLAVWAQVCPPQYILYK